MQNYDQKPKSSMFWIKEVALSLLLTVRCISECYSNKTVDTFNADTGVLLSRNQFSTFQVGSGGFGGPKSNVGEKT